MCPGKEKKVSSGTYFYLKSQAAISICVSKETEKDKSKPSLSLVASLATIEQ